MRAFFGWVFVFGDIGLEDGLAFTLRSGRILMGPFTRNGDTGVDMTLQNGTWFCISLYDSMCMSMSIYDLIMKICGMSAPSFSLAERE